MLDKAKPENLIALFDFAQEYGIYRQSLTNIKFTAEQRSMETLDPVEHDVVEGRVVDLATAATPADVGEAAVCGRRAPTAFRHRRQMDAECNLEPQNMACFELSANQLVYASTPSAPQRVEDACRQGRPASFGLLQNKQRETIWQLKSDASH
jgi:hypothetical protein